MTAQQPAHHKEIVFDRATGDYSLFLNGEFQGVAHDHIQGEIILDALAMAQSCAPQSIDERMNELSDQYKDARAAGNHVLAQTIKRAAMDLAAQKLGITADELATGYAEYKAAA